MRRLLGLKDSTNTPSFKKKKGKDSQQDFTSASISLSSCTPMEVRVSTEVHSAPDRQGFHPLPSTTGPTSLSPASSNSRQLPPEIRVPTYPYPYWQGYTHTPSSSSQSSLESPITPSHVSWLNLANTTGTPDAHSNGSNTSLGLTNSAFVPQPSAGPSSSLVQGRSSPSPHFPPPPPTNPPPNISARPKLLHPTKSTHSLRVPVQEFFNQQLSPIVEQDYLSPEKRPTSLPSSSHEGGGSRSSTAYTARTSAAMTPVSPGSDGIGSATVTPVTPVPMTPVLVSARGTPPTPQTQVQTPVTPSYPGGVVPFARRKEEEGNESPRKNSSLPSPVSTFILRPLNRSISLSSTRTHQSSVSSVTPPVIPPLDLKPEFRGPTFLTTPTSLNSRGLLDTGAHDDDSVSDRRASFVTAQTGPGRESKYSFGQEEVFVDAEDGFRRDSNGTIHAFDSRLLEDIADTPPTPNPPPIPQNTSKSVKPPIPARTTMHPRSASRTSSSPPSYNHPPGSHSSDNHLQPNPYSHPHRPTPSPMHPSRSGLSAPSLQDLGTSFSTSSSFIDRRFAPSSLYLTPASERESARKASSKWAVHEERMDTIQVLFWFGFIAPWCWLIGGWLVPTKPPPRAYGSGSVYGHGYHHGLGGGESSLLPLWTNTSKSMHSFDTMKMYHGYPFVAPSALSLTPPPPPPPYQSQRAAMVLTPKPVGLGRSGMKDPWVRRCRIAAVTSGVIIVVAFIVALVVVAMGHSV
ncbi:hypothetical protein J3R82DRAFT_8015 [Butyriboletus roseoflavus]|nr:hypothetical protein J3R82DRAFT_8015 [Butyriboletus roseoflavus]